MMTFFFLAQVWLWKCFGTSFQSNHWAGHLWLSYKIHFSLAITIQSRNGSLLLSRIRDGTSKMTIFFLKFSVSSWGTHLLSFFTFPVCFRCWMTIEWSILSSLATSHIVIRGSASIKALNCHCQFPMAGHCISHLQGSHLLCKTSWNTTALQNSNYFCTNLVI